LNALASTVIFIYVSVESPPDSTPDRPKAPSLKQHVGQGAVGPYISVECPGPVAHPQTAAGGQGWIPVSILVKQIRLMRCSR
jgi:hypothetical protein